MVVWGDKKTLDLTSLKRVQKKIWSKIGQRRQHTNQRLKDNEILKFQDELRLSEMKIMHRWEKKEIPKGLKNIIIEENLRQFRNRKFKKERLWKHDSISFRLADRSTKEIKEVEIAKSKNGLKNKIKQKCFLTDYNANCRIRNCFLGAPL